MPRHRLKSAGMGVAWAYDKNQGSMRSLVIGVLFGVLSLQAIPGARADSQLLYLTEDVPVSLDPDGPSSTVNTS